jgi:tRNA pseudouridine55 synthase
MQSGFLIINKPSGMTSHDVVSKVRHALDESRVGHGGTLDPQASGVLIVGVGREATKQLGQFSEGTEKAYRAVIRLGATSDTDDAEGMIVESEEAQPLKKAEVQAALKQFKGSIHQAPPIYSATKVGGTRSYDLARQGKAVDLGTHDVEISSIHIEKYDWPILTLEVVCSSGTYIRSLARDVGEALKVGGYLEELTRTRIGKTTLNQAIGLSEVKEKALIGVDKLDTLR